MAFKSDMTMMCAIHAAGRRELERIARLTARPHDDPKDVLGTASGVGDVQVLPAAVPHH